MERTLNGILKMKKNIEHLEFARNKSKKTQHQLASTSINNDI